LKGQVVGWSVSYRRVLLFFFDQSYNDKINNIIYIYDAIFFLLSEVIVIAERKKNGKISAAHHVFHAYASQFHPKDWKTIILCMHGM
jgi:hypothetical protein